MILPNKNQRQHMTKLEKWQAHLSYLESKNTDGRLNGLIATYQDKVNLYKKAQMMCY